MFAVILLGHQSMDKLQNLTDAEVALADANTRVTSTEIALAKARDELAVVTEAYSKACREMHEVSYTIDLRIDNVGPELYKGFFNYTMEEALMDFQEEDRMYFPELGYG